MVSHPAKYSRELLPGLEHLIPDSLLVLDPMAGVGTIRKVCPWAVCIELEHEWAAQCGSPVIIADSTRMPLRSGIFGCICTSPVYGNRMSDHHDAKEKCSECGGKGLRPTLYFGEVSCERCGGKGFNSYRRHTYRHTLGRALHPRNTGRLQWGRKYRAMHEEIWRECYRVMADGGIFILNVSDHIRAHQVQRVSAWHVRTIQSLGFQLVDSYKVNTKRQKDGANRERVAHEYVFRFVKA